MIPAPQASGRAYFLTALGVAVTVLVVAILGSWQRPVTSSTGSSRPDLSVYPWLYSRAGQPGAGSDGVVELIFVGDVMLGRGVVGEPDPFGQVKDWLLAADLAIGNFEGVIASLEADLTPSGYDLRVPPETVARLQGAGLDVLSLANNHTLDLGPGGLAATAAHLQALGIATIGAGPDAGAAAQPLVLEVNRIRLALLAFNLVPGAAEVAVPDPVQTSAGGWVRAEWNQEQATAAVVAARAAGVHAVVVSLHWGYEYQPYADPAQRQIAQALLDAGAGLVIGHHPHVVQETEMYYAGFVAYSLGNFVFDQGQGETGQGLVLRAFFDEQGLRAVQALPVHAGPRPRLMASGGVPPSLLARVQPPSPRTGFACWPGTSQLELDCHPVEVPQEPLSGIFSSGEIDFTGDGVPEQVRREAEQIVIYRDGHEVWRGLTEWRVVDLALGDPNDDGRMEAILALWKEDEAGVPRSHPFILGHRGGRYNLLWGGSAVAQPIHELELGDVTGNGLQELVVLEEWRNSTERTISIWRWHGWGFTLLWRSSPGRYRDLVLLATGDDQPLIITAATAEDR